jgi:hypothetical protein
MSRRVAAGNTPMRAAVASAAGNQHKWLHIAYSTNVCNAAGAEMGSCFGLSARVNVIECTVSNRIYINGAR